MLHENPDSSGVIAVILVLRFIAKRLWPELKAQAFTYAASYVIGTCAAFWTLERLAGF